MIFFIRFLKYDKKNKWLIFFPNFWQKPNDG